MLLIAKVRQLKYKFVRSYMVQADTEILNMQRIIMMI